MTEKLLLIDEVADRIRLSVPSVRRLLAVRRRTGEGIPLPCDLPGKLRWRESDIALYVGAQSNVVAMGRAPPLSDGNSPAKQTKCESQTWHERQEHAKQRLLLHAEGMRKRESPKNMSLPEFSEIAVNGMWSSSKIEVPK